MIMSSKFSYDYKKVRQGFDRSSVTYDEAAVLQREIADRLFQRLEYIQKTPESFLDLGAGTGYVTKKILETYKKALLTSIDLSPRMCLITRKQGGWLRKPQVVCGNAQALPFKDRAFDCVVSSLMLQWCDDLSATFLGINRVLKNEGLFAFSTFGPDTLKELRMAWLDVDDHAHIHTFIDMHDVADELLTAGFEMPVVDMEMITLTYSSVPLLLKDLKMIGANNALTTRPKGLTGRQTIRKLEKAYDKYRTEDGLYPLSYEVIYGHGWGKASLEDKLGVGKVVEIKNIR